MSYKADVELYTKGRGVLTIMDNTGRLLPKGVPFLGFTSWSIWKGREITHCDLLKDLRLITGAFYGIKKKTRKHSGLVIYSYLEDHAFRAVKRDAAFLTSMWKGYHWSTEGVWKGYLFYEKGIKKGNGWGLSIQNFVESPPDFILQWGWLSFKIFKKKL